MPRRYFRFPRPLLVMLVLAAALIGTLLPDSYRKLIEPTAYAANFTVNTADDHNDGVCNGADCSLREAINAVNAGAGGDTISFSIPGGGVRTINVNSALGGLNITKAVTIDGTTQPGFTNSPLIELNGAGAGSVAGLNIAAANVTVKGLIINRFTNNGINIASGSATIQSNLIGTNSAGTSALGNSPAGIKIDGASACTIGGTTVASRNVISGNNGDGILITNSATNNVVQGNFIGVDVTGTSALSNTGNNLGAVNIVSSNNNSIGGSAAGAGNLLSASDGANAYGIQINQSSGTNVQGNIIGLNAAGTAAISNDAGGILILGGVGNTIGGTAVGARNVISGNGGAGLLLLTDTAQVKGNFIGTNGTGTAAIGNGSYGILVNGGDNNTIGGNTTPDRNLISGNQTGVALVSGATGNIVQGNFIGPDVIGTSGLGNGNSQPGVVINDSSNNSIGGAADFTGNVIAFNQGRGVTVESGTGNSILRNQIFSNTDLGIDLGADGPSTNESCDADTGANNKQNFPSILSITPGATNTTISGTLNAAANTLHRIEVFESDSCDPSGNGEGRIFVGSTTVTTDGTCNGTFQLIVPNGALSGAFATATATDPSGNTSEFSSCVPLGIPITNIVQFSASNYNVTEACTGVTLAINRSGDTSGAATVKYATSDVTASERRDYITAIGTLSFAPGETSKNLVVLINDDSYVEGPETLTVTLSNPTSVNLGTPITATVTITDNAAEPVTNVIDDPQTYVCQHYHDFLSREPDPVGLAFWTNEITLCGSDQNCKDVKRINVSAAFYLSIEFQGTGYLVERIYKAAYGDINGVSTFPNNHVVRVPIVRFKELLPDTQEIGKGVIVGQGNWEQQLDSNKSAFTAAFVQRGPFITAFPTSMTPNEFVDKLIQNTQASPTSGERDAAINEFGASVDTSNIAARGRALRRIAEVGDFNTKEVNRAFVLMQYFGYLRRNPNDSPDSDYTGYDFWLTKLIQFNGNFVNAEMVKAFILSGDYRNRFGQ